jgi:hypothetical protein
LSGRRTVKDPRYDGKPLLRLIELYVQHVIGALSARDAQLLVQMTPKLQKTWAREGEWHEVIASVMEFGPSFDPHLKTEWDRARAAGLDAEAFSRAVADKVAAA